ncbi:hypothetical protein CMV30_15025 [Nibricoccus aquaticus]|uniref:Mechanosensitive ion channel MscS domain-containing protein n=1 Tax=Nibricoccus aquaticus TaxID=2576891 RepID=A0A290Q937_9BACT|nr:mechanosensitive ion channel family protein [Nibricoccus aquaticus]ATC65159.1 hypothetical protein CMV30_15025 [Nibricoccus aquaticus]
MDFTDHIFSFVQRFETGPLALLAAAMFATFLIARERRPKGNLSLRASRTRPLLTKMVKWSVVSIAIIGALLSLGIDLRGLWSVLAAMLSLVAIGFVAMWSILSHMLASVLLVTFRPFQIGDKVEIVGDDLVVGKVIGMSLVYTTLRTSDGSVLRIPNNLFFQKVLKRFQPGSLDASPAVAIQEPDLTGANTQ